MPTERDSDPSYVHAGFFSPLSEQISNKAFCSNQPVPWMHAWTLGETASSGLNPTLVHHGSATLRSVDSLSPFFFEDSVYTHWFPSSKQSTKYFPGFAQGFRLNLSKQIQFFGLGAQTFHSPDFWSPRDSASVTSRLQSSKKPPDQSNILCNVFANRSSEC